MRMMRCETIITFSARNEAPRRIPAWLMEERFFQYLKSIVPPAIIGSIPNWKRISRKKLWVESIARLEGK
jgi:hypothetical protein